jgi:hypothetical protein
MWVMNGTQLQGTTPLKGEIKCHIEDGERSVAIRR